MKFNLKSIGGFDVTTTRWVGEFAVNGKPNTRRRETKKHRVMVSVDAAALAQLVAEKVAYNKSGRTRLACGAIEVTLLATTLLETMPGELNERKPPKRADGTS